jgi:hypothetical protein
MNNKNNKMPPGKAFLDSPSQATVDTADSSTTDHHQFHSLTPLTTTTVTPQRLNFSENNDSSNTTFIVLASSGAASGLALVSFLTFVLPYEAIVALTMWFAMLVVFLSSAYTLGRAHLNRIVADRGIGEYLPGWIYGPLVEQTFHEFMTGGDFWAQYQHLVLYFLPGIDVDAYVDRLPPRHRDPLTQISLGSYFLGDDTMRLLMGNERWQDQRNQQVVVVGLPTVVEDDGSASSHSDLGLMVTESDLAGGLTDQQAQTVSASLGLQQPEKETPAGHSDDGESDDLEEIPEEVIIQDAMADAASILYTTVLSYASSVVRPRTYHVATQFFGLSVLTGGLALWGYRRGVYTLPRVEFAAASQQRALWMTTLFGGATTGIALFGYYALRPRSPKETKRG